jgi:hypothetical protein
MSKTISGFDEDEPTRGSVVSYKLFSTQLFGEREDTKWANREAVMIEEPRIARLLFADTRFAWLWLPLRLYLGWAWWEAGWHKFVDPKWIDGGQALLEYWQRGLKMTPKPVIAFDWYRWFIEFLVQHRFKRT